MHTAEEWSSSTGSVVEPTMFPVVIEASPVGQDDKSFLMLIATFNGLCRVVTALADRGLLCYDECVGIEDAMTTPLDDPEWRDNDFIAGIRDSVVGILAGANSTIAARDCGRG